MSKINESLVKRALPAALFTVFLDAIGVAILIPLYVALVMPGPHQIIPAHWSISDGFIMVGWLTGIYSLCTFLAAPILGQLSDKYGRKIVLGLSIIGTALGYALFAIGIIQKNIPLLFLSRALDGITGGNIAIGRAIISDISTPSTRTKNFGLIGAMFGIGFVLGPYLGGRLSAPNIPFINVAGQQLFNTPSWFSPAVPFWFATILAAFNALLVFTVLPETHMHKHSRKIEWTKSLSDIKKAVTMPGVRSVIPVSFLFTGGFTFFTTFFSFTMIKNIPGFTPANVADYFSLIGIWIAVFQGALIPLLAKRFKNYQVLRFSMFGVAGAVLFLLTIRSTTGAILASPLIPMFVAMNMANLIALVSSVAERKIQGEVMGINSSAEALGQGIPAVMSGYIASIAVWLPSVVAASVMVFAGLLFWVIFKPKYILHEPVFGE